MDKNLALFKSTHGNHPKYRKAVILENKAKRAKQEFYEVINQERKEKKLDKERKKIIENVIGRENFEYKQRASIAMKLKNNPEYLTRTMNVLDKYILNCEIFDPAMFNKPNDNIFAWFLFACETKIKGIDGDNYTRAAYLLYKLGPKFINDDDDD